MSCTSPLSILNIYLSPFDVRNVGLAIEELSGAQPNRATVEGLVDYLNNPTTYDGLKDISEVHPSIKGGDIWPKMRTMKQQAGWTLSWCWWGCSGCFSIFFVGFFNAFQGFSRLF